MISQAARLFDIFQRNADRAVLIDARTAEQTTYGQLLDRSRRLTTLLQEKGTRPGDTVVFSVENCAELAELYLACFHAGARIVPINPSFHPRDYAAIVGQ